MIPAAPPHTPESAPFHAAAAEGRFLLRRCTDCEQVHWYPRAICPFCQGETVWEDGAGTGTVYTYSTMSRAKPPYTLAYVELTEGPRMMTMLVDCDPADLAIGQPVKVVFQQAEDGTAIPCFTPA